MIARQLTIARQLCWLIAACCFSTIPARAQDAGPSRSSEFPRDIGPLLNKFCLRCHNADNMESGVRIDQIGETLNDKQLFLCAEIVEQVSGGNMPPEDEPQPSDQQRQLLVRWMRDAIDQAKSRRPQKNGSLRRLTVAQYRNTLRDLLGIREDLTEVLPPDGVSADGFVNNEATMLLSPLLIEAYFDIAAKALDRCIVAENQQPAIQNFRMELGRSINPNPCPDKLILGANSHLLSNNDFVVTQLTPQKPFAFDSYTMRTAYRFIEGYQGNATVRGWRDYDSIYHAVFACMRGTEGYPKGKAYETVPAGLLLRPAIPSSELFGKSSTYGPQANFKISLRELPDQGNFRVTVRAARYEDGLLLNQAALPRTENREHAVVTELASQPATVNIQKACIYQVDVLLQPPPKKPPDLVLSLGKRSFSRRLDQAAFMLVRLPAGPLEVAARNGGNNRSTRVVFTPLEDTDPAAEEFRRFENRSPRLAVHLGLRRDCGSTLTQVEGPQDVTSADLHDYVFSGAINNFPSPDVEKDNVNYLAGLREIGVRSEYTDGRDVPRLLIRSIEFEGPYYEAWPPATHQNIFIDSEHKHDPGEYAKDIIRSFATRAYRRPLEASEQASLTRIWQESFLQTGDFRQSIKDALLVVLTSPQFLFLIEDSQSPEPEPLDPYELASKLSYFLWNTAPDDRLLWLAAAGRLHDSLEAEVDRLLEDARSYQFVSEFASQWLSLDKFDVVEIDQQRYPSLTRDAKTELRKEPVYFLNYLIENNLPLANLIDSEFILANEVVASYYDLADKPESGFRFVPVTHHSDHLGGVLSQAAILSGLSDGRESNPVKRGAWLARKIIAEPPDDPPPNVPELPADDGEHLTLREKLERHRNQKGCAKCHAGIDPWGVPLEQFDAAGLPKSEPADTRSTLPDRTDVADLNELKAYLAEDRIDRVAFSFLKHLAAYATGRSLSYNELEFLKQAAIQMKPSGYPAQDMIRFIVRSKLFLEK